LYLYHAYFYNALSPLKNHVSRFILQSSFALVYALTRRVRAGHLQNGARARQCGAVDQSGFAEVGSSPT